MQRPEAVRTGLVPIDEVARQLGLRASAIRYYQERGLVQPASQHAGKRWFSAEQVRRLAIIRFWQESGLMSLDQIGAILAGAAAAAQWVQTVEAQLDILDRQLDRMQTARALLDHVLHHHQDSSPDGCPHYEALIWQTDNADRPSGRRGAVDGAVDRAVD
jgi:MerR family transcriptional regulator, copper efflux regulator